MQRSATFLVLAGLLVAAQATVGCFNAPDIAIDFGAPSTDEKQDCTTRGGTCQSGACASDEHRIYESSCGPSLFSSTTCCAPGGPPSPTVPPPPKGSNTCNEDACREGCTCTSVTASNGSCEAYCDCSPDAGTPADAGDAEAPDATPIAAPEACGTITCAPGCGCANRSLSKCTCAADACLR